MVPFDITKGFVLVNLRRLDTHPTPLRVWEKSLCHGRMFPVDVEDVLVANVDGVPHLYKALSKAEGGFVLAGGGILLGRVGVQYVQHWLAVQPRQE